MAALALRRRTVKLRDRELRTFRLRGVGWDWACSYCGSEGRERTLQKARHARAAHAYTCPKRPAA